MMTIIRSHPLYPLLILGLWLLRKELVWYDVYPSNKINVTTTG